MKTILFLRGRNAYLPEIPAYISYLEKAFPDVKAHDSDALTDYDLKDFDIIWRFMGMDMKGEGRYVVHEYNSLSARPFPRAKNLIKSTLNRRPDRRVFLNDAVRNGFFFNDNVPYSLRDMGIAPGFFEQSTKKEYDFVYAGSIHRGREVLCMLEHFSSPAQTGNLLIIGSVNAEILERYKPCKNITFTGPVPHGEVPALMSKVRYGLNLIPNRYPFTLQTVTKVLEYCALEMPVVSMRYNWIANFMLRSSGSAFWLDPDFKNLTLEAVESFDSKVPSVEEFEWNKVIKSSGVFDFLRSGA